MHVHLERSVLPADLEFALSLLEAVLATVDRVRLHFGPGSIDITRIKDA